MDWGAVAAIVNIVLGSAVTLTLVQAALKAWMRRTTERMTERRQLLDKIATLEAKVDERDDRIHDLEIQIIQQAGEIGSLRQQVDVMSKVIERFIQPAPPAPTPAGGTP